MPPFRPRTAPLRRPRRLAAAVACGLALTLLAACGTSSTSPAQVTLKVFWWGGPDRAEHTEKALQRYAALHPGTAFDIQWQGYGGYFDKLAIATAGGNAPDIFQIDDNRLSQYATSGITADLDPYVGRQISLDGLTPGLADTGKVDGSLHGLPNAQNVPAMVYDRTLLQEAGLPEPREGWTWEEYAAWAADVTRATGGKYGATDPSGDYRTFLVWLRQRGKTFYRDDHRLGFTKGDLREWFTFWQDQRAAGAVPPADITHNTATGETGKQLVITQQGATSFIVSNQLVDFARSTGHELAVAACPGDLSGQYVRASQYWSMAKTTKHPEEAAEVVDYLVNDLEAARILGADRGMPANAASRARLLDEFGPEAEMAALYEDRVAPRSAAAPPPPPPEHSEIGKLLTDTAEHVVYQRTGIDAAVEEFFTRSAEIFES